MRAVVRQKFEAVRRVVEFSVAHPDAAPAATATVALLRKRLAQSLLIEAERQRQEDQAKEALEERQRAEHRLRADLTHILRLARVIARQQGIAELQPGPRVSSRGPNPLLRTVAAVLERVTPHQRLFLKYGMTPGLFAETAERVAAWQRAEATRRRSLSATLAANPALERAAAEAHDGIRHLDALNRIRFAADPARLALWQAARVVRWSGEAGAAGAATESGRITSVA